MVGFDVKSIREATGLSQMDFSIYSDVPVRTLQAWEAGDRTPPKYVVLLLRRVVVNDLDNGADFKEIVSVSKGMLPEDDNKREEHTITITALRERPTLGLKQGETMTLTLTGDLYLKLKHDEVMGLVSVKEN